MRRTHRRGGAKFGLKAAAKLAVHLKRSRKRAQSRIADKKETCAICLDEIGNEASVKLPCRHIFHERCIAPWMRGHNTCPMCRSVIPPSLRRLPPAVAAPAVAARPIPMVRHMRNRRPDMENMTAEEFVDELRNRTRGIDRDQVDNERVIRMELSHDLDQLLERLSGRRYRFTNTSDATRLNDLCSSFTLAQQHEVIAEIKRYNRSMAHLTNDQILALRLHKDITKLPFQYLLNS
jgi:hypothetical protein